MLRLLLAGAVLLLAMASAEAGYNEGVLAYDGGRYDQALDEFKTLAERGDPDAEFMLGTMYFYGKGVRRNDAVAAIWFYKAASKGNPLGQLAFGSLHIRGIGVRQDLVKAYAWLELAAARRIPQVSDQAARLRDQAARLMRPDEVAQARQVAADWRPRRSGLSSFE